MNPGLPRLSVIVVSYNSADDIETCLRSVRGESETSSERLSTEVIVYDNDSADGSAALAEPLCDVLIRGERNVGFAAAVNHAASVASGDWLLLLNPDGYLLPGAFGSLVADIESRIVDLLALGLTDPHGRRLANPVLLPSVLQEVAVSLAGVRGRSLVDGVRRRVGAVPYHASGAALLIRTDTWVDLGGFDDRFFLYAEETDLCRRAALRGYRVEPSTEPCFVHAGSRGFESKNPTTIRLLLENKLRYFSIHHGLAASWLVWRCWTISSWLKLRTPLVRRYRSRPVHLAGLRAAQEGLRAIAPRRLPATVADVLIYDPDGINPFGRELASLLSETGCGTEVICPFDAGWRPSGVTIRPSLPGNHGGSSTVRQGLRLVRSVGSLAFRSRAQPVIVVWTRTSLEDILFTLLALTGRPIIAVDHNPGARRLRGLRGLTWRMLLRSGRRVVLHPDLAKDARGNVDRQAVVCPHPPYTRWWNEHRRAGDARRPHRLLFLGALRPDKGLSEVVVALAELSASERASTELLVAGRGCLDAGFAAAVGDLGVRLVDRTSDRFLDDSEIAEALAGSGLLLAPYIGATQSGTVALAATASLPVAGYRVGGLEELTPSSNLVPPGDARALGRLVSRHLIQPLPARSEESVARWRIESARRWAALVGAGP